MEKIYLGNVKDNIEVDYLCLRYAKDKSEQRYILKYNEVERRKIAKSYKALVDDVVEINE